MTGQSVGVALLVAGLEESSRGDEGARRERDAGRTASRAAHRGDERAGGGSQFAGHGDEVSPTISDADYVAAIDAAAPPLSAAQRTRLATLLGGGATPTPGGAP